MSESPVMSESPTYKKSDGTEWDIYNFPLPKMSEDELLARRANHREAARRDIEWREWLDDNALSVKPQGQLKEMIRRGIPFNLRSRVWYVICGAEELWQAADSGYYHSVLKGHEDGTRRSTSADEIERDVHRTYPEHPYLQTESGINSLRRVLLAFSIHNTRVGYCQSLNFLVGFLLIVMEQEEEEKVFWTLVATIDTKVHPETYQRDLRGCHVEQRVLKELIDRKLPRLGAHLDRVHCDMVMLTTEWFMCLFLHCLPVEVAARVWDVLLSEGAKVIFRTGLAFFKIFHDELLACTDLTEIISLMRDQLARLYDADLLMHTAFKEIGSLSMDTILSQRKTKGKDVKKELDRREERVREFERKNSKGDLREDQEELSKSFDGSIRIRDEALESQERTSLSRPQDDFHVGLKDDRKEPGTPPKRRFSGSRLVDPDSGEQLQQQQQQHQQQSHSNGNAVGSAMKKELKKFGHLLKKGVTQAKSAIKNARAFKEVKPS